MSRRRIEILSKDKVSGSGASQWHVRDALTRQHFIVSGANAGYTGWEVLVFPGDEKGEVTEFLEVAGGRGISHDEAIADLEHGLDNNTLNDWGVDEEDDA